MVSKRCVFVVLVAIGAVGAMLGGIAPAAAQDKVATAVPALDLDTGPAPESGVPDPLTPKQADGAAPLAPGVPITAPLPTDQPSREVDPIIVAVRARLASNSTHGDVARADWAAVQSYYAEQSQPIWTAQTGFMPRTRQAIDEIGRADDWGLVASNISLPGPLESSPTGDAPADSLADAEIKLSLAVLKYARQARGGRLDPAAVSRKFDQRPTIFDPKSVLQAIAAAPAADTYLQGLHPQHEQFKRLRAALLAARRAFAADATGGDAKSRAGIRQIIANMERWRWMPENLGAFYVWDSIPDQMTYVVDNGKDVLSERIVVGKLSSPTPVFSADMQFVIFHPSWGVPPGMKAGELWPKLRDTGGGWFSSKPLASQVLRAHGLQVTRAGFAVDPDSIDWEKVNIQTYDFTQGPGATNVLGAVKFRFPNKHDVYMHDTPERNLFGGKVRAFSHGCMRVQNPMHLAEVLLSHDRGWSLEKIRDEERHGGEVKLATPIPVHVTYFTLRVDDTGALLAKPDIYDLDNRVTSALEGHRVVASSGAVDDESPRVPRAVGAVHKRPKVRHATASGGGTLLDWFNR